MNQVFLMPENKRNVLLPGCLGVSDIPRQAEFRTFQKVFHSFFLIVPKPIRIFDCDRQVTLPDPFLAQGSEHGKRLHVRLKVTVIQLYLPVRQGNIYAVVHVHIQRQRLAGIPVPVPKA